MTTLIQKFKQAISTAVNQPTSDIFAQTYSVKNFGATGDGVTDDTTAIQNALDAISVSQTSGTLMFPPGVYRTTAELTSPSLNNIWLSASGSFGTAGSAPRTSSVTILYDGAVAPTKAVFRSTGGTGAGNQTRVTGIAFDAGLKAGYGFVIEGAGAGTYHNTWQFYSCAFAAATKVGAMIGTFDGSVDVDSYQVNFWECLFDKSPFGIYANAQNNYGPFVERCYFADSFQSGSSGYVINHIRTKANGDYRIYNSFFGQLAPAATVIDPQTGVAVVDTDIFCCYLQGAGTMSDCWTEEPRVLKHTLSSQQFDACMLSNINVNSNASADERGRNLNWSLGDAAYSVYVEGQLTISNCQFGGASGSVNANFYRRIYNNGTLAINCAAQNDAFLGPFGQVIHGANSRVVELDGQNPNTIVASPNWALSNWQDANILLDNVSKFNGASGVSTVTKSASNVFYGSASAEVITTVAATTYISGLQVNGNPTPNAKNVTLIVAGYSAAGVPALRPYLLSGAMTPLGTTDGNADISYNATSKRFIARVSYSIDNTLGVNYGSVVGINGTGTIYYNVATFVNGYWDLARVSAMLPFLGANSLTTNGYNSVHYGTAAPTVGTWQQGDIVWKSNAASGGTPGYVCTTAGTPGTWKAMGNLA